MRRDDAIVRPERFLRYLRRDLGLRPSEMQLPPKAVVVFGTQDFRDLRGALNGKATTWNRWVCVGRAEDVPVAVARSQIGAPATAITAEEMAALGCREFLTLGACGSLVRDLRIGDIVVPTFAYSDEGTSRHYGRSGRARPDPRLTSALAAACERRSFPCLSGGTWTMDAVYRESRSRARLLVRRGVIAVEMEAAAVWSLARHRRIRAASLFVVSDELAGQGWNPGFRDPAFLEGKKRAIRVLVDVLAGEAL